MSLIKIRPNPKKPTKQELRDNIKVTTLLGNTFDGDLVSRNNMMNKIETATVLNQALIEWKMADNSKKFITLAELKEALKLLIAREGEIVLTYQD